MTDSPTDWNGWAGILFYVLIVALLTHVPSQLYGPSTIWIRFSRNISQYVPCSVAKAHNGHTKRGWSGTARVAENRLASSVRLPVFVCVLLHYAFSLAHERNDFKCYTISAAGFDAHMARRYSIILSRFVSHESTWDGMYCTLSMYLRTHHATGSWVRVDTPDCTHATNTNTRWCNAIMARMTFATFLTIMFSRTCIKICFACIVKTQSTETKGGGMKVDWTLLWPLSDSVVFVTLLQ